MNILTKFFTLFLTNSPRFFRHIKHAFSGTFTTLFLPIKENDHNGQLWTVMDKEIISQKQQVISQKQQKIWFTSRNLCVLCLSSMNFLLISRPFVLKFQEQKIYVSYILLAVFIIIFLVNPSPTSTPLISSSQN